MVSFLTVGLRVTFASRSLWLRPTLHRNVCSVCHNVTSWSGGGWGCYQNNRRVSGEVGWATSSLNFHFKISQKTWLSRIMIWHTSKARLNVYILKVYTTLPMILGFVLWFLNSSLRMSFVNTEHIVSFRGSNENEKFDAINANLWKWLFVHVCCLHIYTHTQKDHMKNKK